MTRKLRLLDLMCGAGGCSVGYARAGFEVVGVDIEPQPNYPYEFVQADAFEFFELVRLGEFEQPAAWHCSPPCQHYAGSTAWRGDRSKHPDLIAPTRELLEATGLPYVIENVPDARRHLHNPLMLCGSAFGLPVRRHRYFEANWPIGVLTLGCHHQAADLAFMHKGERAYADAMGCDWMTSVEARQAVPPAYTTFIGAALMAHIEGLGASPSPNTNKETT